MTKSSSRSALASLGQWIPSMRGMLLILAAFGLGLLAFFFLWVGQRPSTPQVAPVAGPRAGPEFAPLPAPMPADQDGASGLEQPDEDALAEQPRLIEAPHPPAAPAPPPEAAPAPSAAPTLATSAPSPISTPSPRYPDRAMRRRETGTVRLQVEVGIDGEPTSVSIASSSQSRDLDRAAMDAVRKWRFRPAQRDGQAVAGTIIVPVEFKL